MENTEEKHKDMKGKGMNHPLRPRLLALKEAAFYLGRTPWGMREIIWAGKIPIVRDGKKIFLDVHDLDKYVEQNKTSYL